MCSTPDFFMNHAIELHTRYGLVYRQRSSVCLSSPEMYHCVLSITVFLKPVNEPCFEKKYRYKCVPYKSSEFKALFFSPIFIAPYKGFRTSLGGA